MEVNKSFSYLTPPVETFPDFYLFSTNSPKVLTWKKMFQPHDYQYFNGVVHEQMTYQTWYHLDSLKPKEAPKKLPISSSENDIADSVYSFVSAFKKEYELDPINLWNLATSTDDASVYDFQEIFDGIFDIYFPFPPSRRLNKLRIQLRELMINRIATNSL